MTINATTTFTNHFTNFFHLSHSHAEITLNHVTTIIIIAKKNAATLTTDKTLNKTESFHIKASLTHHIPPHCKEGVTSV